MSEQKEQAAELKTYTGSCHCGNVRFSVQLDPITKEYSCDCSICSRIAYMWTMPTASNDLTMEKGEDFLKDYEFGRNTMKHKFCPKCGSSIMAAKHDGPEGKKIALNARMLHDVNLDSLKKVSFDGVGLEPRYHAPQVSSKLVAKDGFKIYHGNCHCGAVTYSVQSEPFTETGPPVCECDCSICSRNGYLTIYPRIADVEIHGEDALTGYAFGERTTHKFCSLCGTSLFNDINNPKQDMRCVNIRALNGLDVKRLNIVRNYAPPIVFFED